MLGPQPGVPLCVAAFAMHSSLLVEELLPDLALSHSLLPQWLKQRKV